MIINLHFPSISSIMQNKYNPAEVIPWVSSNVINVEFILDCFKFDIIMKNGDKEYNLTKLDECLEHPCLSNVPSSEFSPKIKYLKIISFIIKLNKKYLFVNYLWHFEKMIMEVLLQVQRFLYIVIESGREVLKRFVW